LAFEDEPDYDFCEKKFLELDSSEDESQFDFSSLIKVLETSKQYFPMCNLSDRRIQLVCGNPILLTRENCKVHDLGLDKKMKTPDSLIQSEVVAEALQLEANLQEPCSVLPSSDVSSKVDIETRKSEAIEALARAKAKSNRKNSKVMPLDETVLQNVHTLGTPDSISSTQSTLSKSNKVTGKKRKSKDDSNQVLSKGDDVARTSEAKVSKKLKKSVNESSLGDDLLDDQPLSKRKLSLSKAKKKSDEVTKSLAPAPGSEEKMITDESQSTEDSPKGKAVKKRKLSVSKVKRPLSEKKSGDNGKSPSSLDPRLLNRLLEDPSAVVGMRVEVYWPDDDAWYSGTISKYFKTTNQHRISYDDGDKERLFLVHELWREAS
jgi:hypothetical protein